MEKYIAVAGNIGAGKSSLVELLCDQLGCIPFYEPVNDNPYLEDFYKDMSGWGFHSQIYFLSRRLRIHHNLINQTGSVILDRTLYEDAEIFAKNLYVQQFINERDYETYSDLYNMIIDLLPPPDLVIYLRSSVNTLKCRIQKRGREYEKEISSEYLDQLNQLYELWIDRFNLCPLLIVPCDDLDFVAKSNHLSLITEKVYQMLMGKSEVHF